MRQVTIVLILSFTSIIGCNKIPLSQNPSNSTNEGLLKISLTDSPGEFDEVNITFSEISAHLDSDWVTVRGIDTTVNLLEWTNGRSLVIGSADVPAGKYTQIRIKIDTAWVVVDGLSYELTVPSGAQTGLKLGHQFTITEGSTYELVADFDVNRSIVTNGPPQNPKNYKLTPRIRVISKALSGSISGTVTNPQNVPVAYAIAGIDTVTSTYIDTINGQFMLAFLPEDSYTVSIKDTLDQAFGQNDVQVTVGTNNDLGMITLQK